MKIVEVGLQEDYPDYLKRKIVISNMIALVIAFLVALPFVFISLIFFPPLAYLPIVAVPIALTTLLFNFLKFHNLAWIVISLVPISLASIYQAYLSTKGEAVTPGLSAIMLSFSFIIFVIFDLRERTLLIALSVIMAGIMLSMDYMNDTLEMPLDTEIIKTGFLAKLVVMISIISGAGCILILVFQNQISELKTQELLEESRVQQQRMLQQEQELKDNLIRLEDAHKEEARRQMVNEGISRGMVIMRNQLDLKKMTDELISFIVRYLNVNQGGFFIVNDDDQNDVHLELLSVYAYDKKKYVERRVNIGEGLLGQTYLEKATVYIKAVPGDYVKISSGLGLATPTTLLILPLKVNDTVSAMVELASFREFQAHEINFIESE